MAEIQRCYASGFSGRKSVTLKVTTSGGAAGVRGYELDIKFSDKDGLLMIPINARETTSDGKPTSDHVMVTMPATFEKTYTFDKIVESGWSVYIELWVVPWYGGHGLDDPCSGIISLESPPATAITTGTAHTAGQISTGTYILPDGRFVLPTGQIVLPTIPTLTGTGEGEEEPPTIGEIIMGSLPWIVGGAVGIGALYYLTTPPAGEEEARMWKYYRWAGEKIPAYAAGLRPAE